MTTTNTNPNRWTISLSKAYRTSETLKLLGVAPTTKLCGGKYNRLVHTPDGYTGASIVEQIKDRSKVRPNHPIRVSCITWEKDYRRLRAVIIKSK